MSSSQQQTPLSLNIQYINGHTERMFGNDRLLCNERFTLSLIVDRSHTELVLFTLVQAGDITLRRSTVLTDRCPLAGLFVLLLHDIVTDGLAAIVLQSTTGSVRMAQVLTVQVLSTKYNLTA